MKILTIILALLISTSAFGLSFKKKGNFVKIKTDQGEYTYMDISDLVIIYDVEEKTAYIGFHDTAPKPDIDGRYNPIFMPLREFKFDETPKFLEWIKTVMPYEQCLGNQGLVKCK